MANEKKYNPFSMLDSDDEISMDDVVNASIHSELKDLLDDLDLNLEGNKLTVKDKPKDAGKQDKA